MTRKRFTKLLMSRGYQRDAAEQIACKECESHYGYSSYWKVYRWLFDLHKNLVGFNKAIKVDTEI